MERRYLLTTVGSTLGVLCAGCSGNRSQNGAESGGDIGNKPPTSLEMNAITDTEIAKRTTYRIDYRHRTSERQLAASVIETGSAEVTATTRPFPENRPFIYDGSVYELVYETVDSEAAKRFRITIDSVDGDISDDETIFYDDLPEVDKEMLESRGWGNPDVFAVEGVATVYRDDDLSDSVLVPEPDYPVILSDSETHGRVSVEGSADTELKVYEYAATRVHESAEEFGRTIRNEHEFALSGLPEAEETIISEAISAERGYHIPEEESIPESFERLVERFSQQKRIDYVDEEDGPELPGSYIVSFIDNTYWTDLVLRDEKTS